MSAHERQSHAMRFLLLPFLSLLLLAAPMSVNAASASSGAGAGLPADSASQGYIGLCDETGHNVTGGSLDAAPFIWKAVASVAPPNQFQGTGQNAVLNAYQPRPQVAPAQWSGGSLTSASFYSSAAHPAVQATYADESMGAFAHRFPSMVNGLYVLRMYYGKSDYGLYNRTYPTTTIQVVGTRWNVVSGGTVDCSAAKAISNEQRTGVVTRKQITPRAPAAGASTVAPGGKSPASGSAAGSAAGGGAGGSVATGPISRTPQQLSGSSTNLAGGTGAEAAAAQNTTSNGSGSTVWPWLLLALLVLLGGGYALVRRRNSSPTSTT